jgi:acyl-CoA synthetase (AMP-forming)/AMP-acid ligase II
MGERVHIAVGLTNGKEKDFENDIVQFAKQRLPSFARPEWIYIVRSCRRLRGAISSRDHLV